MASPEKRGTDEGTEAGEKQGSPLPSSAYSYGPEAEPTLPLSLQGHRFSQLNAPLSLYIKPQVRASWDYGRVFSFCCSASFPSLGL